MTWILSRECADDVKRIRFALGDDYAHNVSQQRQMLCDYFSGDAGCSARGGLVNFDAGIRVRYGQAAQDAMDTPW